MARLVPCASCHRHRRASDAACPFCGARHLALRAGLVAFAALGIGWNQAGARDARDPDARSETYAPPGASVPVDGGADAADIGERRREADLGNVIPLYGVPPGPRTGC